ncbi:MAG TPA: hypothetical protein VNP72_06255, partial [Longimicrobium sp.]|nr:hypothetical protein [Longimicrobium sp.]
MPTVAPTPSAQADVTFSLPRIHSPGAPRANAGTLARLAACCCLLATAACAPTPTPGASSTRVAAVADTSSRTTILDDFETIAGWSAHPSEGVELRISQDSGFSGRSMRLDFDFRGGAGYAIARRRLPPSGFASRGLPDDYEFSFRVRADAPVNNL